MVCLYVPHSKHPFSLCFSAFPSGYKKCLSVNIKKFYLILLSLQLKRYTLYENFINNIYVYYFRCTIDILSTLWAILKPLLEEEITSCGIFATVFL